MSLRVRRRGALSPIRIYENSRFTTCSDFSWHLNAEKSPAYSGRLDLMSDTVVERFKKRQAAGELFFNNMSYSGRTYSASGSGWSIRGVRDPGCFSPVMYPEYQGVGPWLSLYIPNETIDGKLLPAISSLVSESDIKSLKKEVSTDVMAKRGRGDVNIYEDLAEMDQTLDLFHRPLSRLSTWLNSTSRAVQQRKILSHSAKSGSDLWLAYRYGIRPIVADIDNVVKALQKKARPTRKTTRGHGSTQSTSIINGFGSVGVTKVGYANYVTDRVDVRGMSLDDLDFALIDDLGLSPKSLITLPWELVKYSFVVDWFLNIGDYLNALAPAFGWKQLGSCLVTTRTIANSYGIASAVVTDSGYVADSPLEGVVNASLVTRVRGPMSSPGIVVKSDFGLDKATRIADAFTLAAQRLSRVFHVRAR